MSTTATPLDVEVSPCERLEALHAEIGELTGQRNAIDALTFPRDRGGISYKE